MPTSIQEYSATEAALAVLGKKYANVVFDVTTPKGMAAAKASRAELRKYRIDLEKKRVEIKAPALKRSQEIDSEARRITASLSDLEDPIDQQIKTEENKAEIARQAAERAAKEAEEARLAAERAELDRRAAEIAAAEKASRDKIEADERAARLAREEEERKARLEREEADRAARQTREAEEAKARAERQAEEDRQRAERDRLDAERRALEEQQRQAREAEEAAAREITRKQNELLDGRAMLETFMKLYSHRPEFAPIAARIKTFLET